MDRVNWVDGRYTTPSDFNAPQIAAESHLEAQAAQGLAGRVDGCIPVGAGIEVTIGAGTCWDSAGHRIVIPAGGAPVDMTSVDRPASGQYRWLAWYVEYRRLERGSMQDKAGEDRPAYYDDGFRVGVRQGAAFAAAGLRSARGDQISSRPAAPGGSVGLGYSILDHDGNYGSLFSAATLYRRDSPRAIVPIAVSGAGGRAANLLAPLERILPRRRDYAFGAGGVRIGNSVYPILYAARPAQGPLAVYYVSRAIQSETMLHASDRLDAIFDRVISYGPDHPAGGSW